MTEVEESIQVNTTLQKTLLQEESIIRELHFIIIIFLEYYNYFNKVCH